MARFQAEPDLAAVVDTGPPGPSGEIVETPYLGVRKDYTTQGGLAQDMTPDAAMRWGEQEISPRYLAGDQFKPQSYSAERRAEMQIALVQAGLIGPKTKFRVGTWDPASSSAYATLLSYANQAGVDEMEALRQLASSPQTTPIDLGLGEDTGPANFQTAVHTVEKSSPATIKQAVEDAWVAAHGRKPTARQIAQFQSVYTRLETGPQRQVNAARDQAAGDARQRDLNGVMGDIPISTTVETTTPNLGAEAQEFAENADPAGNVAHTAASKVFGSFLNMLGGVTPGSV